MAAPGANDSNPTVILREEHPDWRGVRPIPAKNLPGLDIRTGTLVNLFRGIHQRPDDALGVLRVR